MMVRFLPNKISYFIKIYKHAYCVGQKSFENVAVAVALKFSPYVGSNPAGCLAFFSFYPLSSASLNKFLHGGVAFSKNVFSAVLLKGLA